MKNLIKRKIGKKQRIKYNVIKPIAVLATQQNYLLLTRKLIRIFMNRINLKNSI